MKNKLEPIYKVVSNSIKKAEGPIFTVFDFDNTCIVNDIGDATLAFMARNNLFRDKNLLPGKFEDYSRAVFENYHNLYNAGQIKEAYEFMAKTLSGFYVDEISRLAEDVIKFEGEEIKIAEVLGIKIAKGLKPREQITELINFLKNNGVEVWIVSASPELLVRQAMKHFNIEANLIGVRNVIVDGKITDELEEPLSMFEEKVDCIKKYISRDKKPLLGVGDSMNDLPMLEYCEIKVVVDRQNELAKKAKQNNWFLIG